MPLPSFEVPTYEIELISTGQKINIRPFLVKEEKLLLMALETDDKKTIIDAIQQILENCIKTKNIKIKELASFDVEYIFLKIREKSLGEVVPVRVTCPDTEKLFDVDLNLGDIIVVKDPNHKTNIEISDSFGIFMKYPSFSTMQILSLEENPVKRVFKIISSCIKSIYDKDNTYNASEYSEKEVQDFLDNLPQSAFDKINNFYETLPKILFQTEVKSPYSQKMVKVRLDNFMDFFG